VDTDKHHHSAAVHEVTRDINDGKKYDDDDNDDNDYNILIQRPTHWLVLTTWTMESTTANLRILIFYNHTYM